MKGRTQAIALIALVALAVIGFLVYRSTRVNTGVNPPKVSESWTPQSIADPRIRSVVEELIDRWDKLPAVSVSLNTSLPDAAGMKGTTTGTCFYEMQRNGPTTLTKFRVINKLLLDSKPGERLLTTEIIIQLFDGEFLYLHLNQPSNQSVTKTFYDPSRVFHIGGRELFATMFTNNHVELTGEETFGEWQTYVLTARPKDGDWTAKYWFDKATGVQVQLIETKLSGAPQLTMTVEKVDTNPQFPADRFRYAVPEGFQVTDETVKP